MGQETKSKSIDVNRQEKELLERKERTRDELGFMSPEDLRKIQVMIEGFKKQYGKDWDSSAIEADLKKILERQLKKTQVEKPKEEGKQQMTAR